MKSSKHLFNVSLLSLALLAGCSKKDDTVTPDNSSTAKESFIQFDDKKNAPVTQKADPYNRSQKNSCFFGSTTLDMTTKAGSSAAIVQTILEYSVPNKSLAETDALAKTLFDGIAEGKSIKAKILGDDSMISGTATGFYLRGSVSAGTGAWDYTYNEKADIEFDISKVNGKIQFSLSTPATLNLLKRAGAGDPKYSNFSATSMFSLQIAF